MHISSNINPTSANCIQPKEAEVSSFDHLPSEIIQQIFSHLNNLELGKCCQVNRSWQTLASDNALWKKLFPQVDLPQDENIKAYLNNHIIKSEEDMMKRLQEFAAKVFSQDKGSFTCLYARHPGVNFNATFGHKGKVLFSEKPGLQEIWMSIENLAPYSDRGPNIIVQQANLRHTCKLIQGTAFSSEHRGNLFGSIAPVLDERLDKLEEMANNGNPE